MKCKITAVGEGISEGTFECSKEEFKIIEKAIDSLGNLTEGSYSPSVFIEALESSKTN